MNKYTFKEVITVSVVVLAIFGYLMNIYKLFNLIGTAETVEAIIRGIGLFVAPLGAIFGYF